MHKGDGLLGDPRLPQALVDEGCFLPGADDAHIGCLAPQHLHLHLKIVLVAVGHDDHKVLCPHGQIVADVGEVAADDLIRLRESLPGGKLGPVIEHHRPEAHGTQQRHQRTGNMPRAEDQCPLADGQRHCKAVLLAGIVVRQIGHRAVQRLHQPARLPCAEPPQHLRRQRVPRAVRRRDAAEVHGHIAATDHAGALGAAVPAQAKFVGTAVRAAMQHLLCKGDSLPLHGAAADGAGQQAVLPYQHLAALAPGRGAVVPDDGGQHRVMALLPLVHQRLKNGMHGLSSRRRSGCSRTPSGIYAPLGVLFQCVQVTPPDRSEAQSRPPVHRTALASAHSGRTAGSRC